MSEQIHRWSKGMRAHEIEPVSWQVADELDHLQSLNNDLVAALEAMFTCYTYQTAGIARKQARAVLQRAKEGK